MSSALLSASSCGPGQERTDTLVPFHPDHCGGLRPIGARPQESVLLSVFGINVLLPVGLPKWPRRPGPRLMVAATCLRRAGTDRFIGPLLPFRDGMKLTSEDHDGYRLPGCGRARAIRDGLTWHAVASDDEAILERLKKIGSLIDDLPVWPSMPEHFASS